MKIILVARDDMKSENDSSDEDYVTRYESENNSASEDKE